MFATALPQADEATLAAGAIYGTVWWVCAGCRITRDLVEAVRRLPPAQPVEVIDIGAPVVPLPTNVVGTPTFLFGERVVALGNAALDELLAILDATARGPSPRAS